MFIPASNVITQQNTQVTMSKTLIYENYNWNGTNVIDGSMSMDASMCNCCAATQTSSPRWLQLDFNHQYLVQFIQILGRTGDMLYLTMS